MVTLVAGEIEGKHFFVGDPIRGGRKDSIIPRMGRCDFFRGKCFGAQFVGESCDVGEAFDSERGRCPKERRERVLVYVNFPVVDKVDEGVDIVGGRTIKDQNGRLAGGSQAQ